MRPQVYAEMAARQDSHWWFAARRQILRSQLRQLRLPANPDILEIGSGTGANLDLLAEFGRVVGLEMNPSAIDLARQRTWNRSGAVSMRLGRCPDDMSGLPSFDLVCMFDVLEHIGEDGAALAAAAARLKPGGRLLVTVPSYQWMWGPHDEQLHHKPRYTRRTMAERCAGAGLEVHRLSYFNTLLFPFAVARRLFEKAGGGASAAVATPAQPINAALRWTFSFERHLLAHVRLPFGLSLMTVAGRATALEDGCPGRP